jgi:hypothetical protein
MRETVGDILNKYLLTEHLKRDPLQKELAVLKSRKDRPMATKDLEMSTIDPRALDVEELEERLELAAMFATTPGNTNGEQVVAVDWGNCSPSGPYVC